MIRIFAEQLNSHLAQHLNRIYYLVGQDPLLLEESNQQIIQAAQAQQFDEKYQLIIDNTTDWNALFERCQAMGLFFSRQVISLILPDKLTSTLQQKLAELITLLHQDILLILQFNKLTKEYEKQKWYQQANEYEPQLLQVNCQTPNIAQYPRWIAQRAKTMGLNLDQEATQLLSYSYENNLLALHQTLQLLALLYPDHKLSYPRVKEVVEQSSVFTPYQWIDALLEGKEKRAKRILEGLQQEDIQPIILLRILQKELNTLLEISQPQQKIYLDQSLPHQQLNDIFSKLKIWQNRRPLFLAILKRFTYRQLFQTYRQLAEIERAIKQDFSSDIWQQLEDLSMNICTTKHKED
ncbi:DNA polymerase III subunit delta [Volucribacter amazonae]|uniref:DNA polymerase III subunit delta n=1 Tax=Volucribacter amazonae TaxID=256731 RepID=A0A9X4PIY4_9PAST|nr:DNA polymerase III subunit delta [Volucribacter amazonae]MDG6896200.1 DNA polymerase III subunit delta [Volucribacter amazonae]